MECFQHRRAHSHVIQELISINHPSVKRKQLSACNSHARTFTALTSSSYLQLSSHGRLVRKRRFVNSASEDRAKRDNSIQTKRCARHPTPLIHSNVRHSLQEVQRISQRSMQSCPLPDLPQNAHRQMLVRPTPNLPPLTTAPTQTLAARTHETQQRGPEHLRSSTSPERSPSSSPPTTKQK
jgi:hypothetical protein